MVEGKGGAEDVSTANNKESFGGTSRSSKGAAAAEESISRPVAELVSGLLLVPDLLLVCEPPLAAGLFIVPASFLSLLTEERRPGALDLVFDTLLDLLLERLQALSRDRDRFEASLPVALLHGGSLDRLLDLFLD